MLLYQESGKEFFEKCSTKFNKNGNATLHNILSIATAAKSLYQKNSITHILYDMIIV